MILLLYEIEFSNHFPYNWLDTILYEQERFVMRVAISLMLVIPSTISMTTIAILLLTIMLQSSDAGKIL